MNRDLALGQRKLPQRDHQPIEVGGDDQSHLAARYGQHCVVARPPLSTGGMIIMLVWMQCSHETPLLIMRPLMVTLAGLEPATSPAPANKDALSPLELQRRHDLHNGLWQA